MGKKGIEKNSFEFFDSVVLGSLQRGGFHFVRGNGESILLSSVS